MEYRKKCGIIFFCLSAGFLISRVNCYAAAVSRMRMVMGTLLQIEVVSDKRKTAEDAVESAFKEVERLDNLLSNYKEDSEISRINREAYPHGTVTTDEMILFLSRAKQLSEMTGGAYDITIDPLTQLWKLRERKLEKIPVLEEIENAKSKVNYKNLEIAASAKTIRFLVPGMGIDTGGIGKGYTLDKALEKIREFPVESAAFNFGGEILYWLEQPQKRILKIKDPLNQGNLWEETLFTTHSLTSAVSTSGNYERFVTLTSTDPAVEKRFGHILNPRTGEPVENDIRSVTVIANNAADADAFSTAIFVMDLQEGIKFAEQMKEIGVITLYETNNKSLAGFKSNGWKKWQLSSVIHPKKKSKRVLELIDIPMLSPGFSNSIGVGKK